MNPSQAQIDISAKLQRTLGELLDRETKAAQQVLSSGEVLATMIEACACVMATTAATAAASHPDEDYGANFDHALNAVFALVRADRERAMARIAESRGSGAPS